MNRRWKYTGQGIFSNVGGEVVILNLSTNHYYGLNEIATKIWETLEASPSVEEIASIIVSEYDVNMEECLSDIQTILQEMKTLELVIEVKES